MLSPIITEDELKLWNEVADHCHRAVVTAHAAPDGDAVGSSLALAGYLRSRGIEVKVVLPDSLPEFLTWLPGAGDIICYDVSPDEAVKAIGEADVIYCTDFNNLSRINDLADAVVRSEAPRVMIDHHLPDADQAVPMGEVLKVCRPDFTSASEVLFHLLWQAGYFSAMTRDEAVCIYCGMMTDTGCFAYNSARPEVFFVVSELLTKGFDRDKVYRNVFYNYSKHRVRLTGYILYHKLHFYKHLRACYYTLTGDEMRRFSFQRGDAEGIVNTGLIVKGMKLSVAFREDTEKDVIRVSLRSVDDFPCNKLAAEYFGGGGHLNASGGEYRGTMEEAVATLNKAVEAYRDQLL